MPLTEIVRAAQAHQADIVALSFSTAFPHRQIPPQLEQLRQLLPPEIELWVGGGGIRRVTPSAGIKFFGSLKAGVQALADPHSAVPAQQFSVR